MAERLSVAIQESFVRNASKWITVGIEPSSQKKDRYPTGGRSLLETYNDAVFWCYMIPASFLHDFGPVLAAKML